MSQTVGHSVSELGSGDTAQGNVLASWGRLAQNILQRARPVIGIGF